MAVTYEQTIVFTASNADEYVSLKATALAASPSVVADDNARTVTFTASGTTTI